jgi:type II secretory pathway pseudopilin PulG
MSSGGDLMNGKLHRAGFTFVELLVVIILVGVAIILILPAIDAARGLGQRNVCASNLKQIGVALWDYQEAHRNLPPGCNAGQRDPENGHVPLEKPWSWIVYVLPHMDSQATYESLDLERSGPLDKPSPESGKASRAHETARNTLLSVLKCPHSPCTGYRAPAARTDALTSYKALSATHWESLRFGGPNPTNVRPKYPKDTADVKDLIAMHPDGVMYPGSKTRVEDIIDGASYTAVVVECLEPKAARWTFGPETMLYALNPLPAFEFSPSFYQAKGAKGEEPYQYWCPPKFRGQFGDRASAEMISACKPCIRCDYVAPPDQGTYTAALEDADSGNEPYLKQLYGPSSGHETVVNHLFADGSARGIDKKVDAATIMFITTRAGRDPVPEPLFR